MIGRQAIGIEFAAAVTIAAQDPTSTDLGLTALGLSWPRLGLGSRY
jgi:hypothetical protein